MGIDTSEGGKSAWARPGMGEGIDWSRLRREMSEGTFPAWDRYMMYCLVVVEDAMNEK